ncbi:hypothetical protein F5Y19DRAFT_212302 [Xylariaceae sp. FL1651]|nr:hypothetical protein F5Y19DRAFT_212302 [Xylariaceae sp. FL1651]
MEFFWVRNKPRHSKEKHNSEGIGKGEEKKRLGRGIEARPKDKHTRKRDFGAPTHRRLRKMAHSHTNATYWGPQTSGREQRCACACRCPRCICVVTNGLNHDQNWIANLHDLGDSTHQGSPRVKSTKHVPKHQEWNPNLNGREPPISSGQQPKQSDRVYIHPYSTLHYQFPVVDHSTMCHGVRLAPCPACYVALVPEFATVYDIGSALASRPGLVVMTRLLGTGERVPISTFRCPGDLYQASLQLEVLSSDNEDSSPEKAVNGAGKNGQSETANSCCGPFM